MRIHHASIHASEEAIGFLHQMSYRELYDYILEMREYIVKLEQRIAKLEHKVDPPHYRDLGNGRTSLTKAGMDSFMDGLVGVHQKDKDGNWKKVR